MKGKSYRLPKPVYEFLPAFYIMLGIASIVIISSRLAVTCGLVLLLIGGLIIVQRRNYRSDSQAINQNRRDSNL